MSSNECIFCSSSFRTCHAWRGHQNSREHQLNIIRFIIAKSMLFPAHITLRDISALNQPARTSLQNWLRKKRKHSETEQPSLSSSHSHAKKRRISKSNKAEASDGETDVDQDDFNFFVEDDSI